MKLLDVFLFIQKTYSEKTKKSHGDVEWLHAYHESYTFIGVRGSEFYSTKWFIDLLRNLLASIPYYSKELKMWVSLGYYFAARRCAKDVVNALHLKTNTPLLICGHSLGAAVSFLTAMLLAKRGFNVRKWVGIGSANSVITYPTKLTFDAYNYKYEEDIVSNYPPKFLAFKQPSDIIHIGVDNSTGLKIGNVKDHSVENYVKNCPDVYI